MTNQPIHTIRDGACKVTIWQNPKAEGEGFWYEAVPGRTYTDSQDKAQTAHGFSNGDILKIAHLLDDAYRWIRQQKLRDRHEAGRRQQAA